MKHILKFAGVLGLILAVAAAYAASLHVTLTKGASNHRYLLELFEVGASNPSRSDTVDNGAYGYATWYNLVTTRWAWNGPQTVYYFLRVTDLTTHATQQTKRFEFTSADGYLTPQWGYNYLAPYYGNLFFPDGSR